MGWIAVRKCKKNLSPGGSQLSLSKSVGFATQTVNAFETPFEKGGQESQTPICRIVGLGRQYRRFVGVDDNFFDRAFVFMFYYNFLKKNYNFSIEKSKRKQSVNDSTKLNYLRSALLSKIKKYQRYFLFLLLLNFFIKAENRFLIFLFFAFSCFNFSSQLMIEHALTIEHHHQIANLLVFSVELIFQK